MLNNITENHYIIGDLQGCFNAFQRLLTHINFNPKTDTIWFAGDLVARGEDSLSTLRYVKELCEQGCAKTVLGNHDITLIAAWRNIVKTKKKDNVDAILIAEDCDELLDWLRQQPLILSPTVDTVLVHAGIPPHWTINDAQKHAHDVEAVLRADLATLDEILPHMYKREAGSWSLTLDTYARLRAITNYFTRMRLCDAKGDLELRYKEDINGDMPEGFKPWFDWKPNHVRTAKVIFGHWAALKANTDTEIAKATDGGCVWGGELIAYRLHDKKTFSVSG